jgi:predicted nucleotidyltransferase
MNKHKITPEEKSSLIEEIALRLKKKNDVLFAYIFGSFAQSDLFSDIDIAIFTDEKSSKESLDYEFHLEEEIRSCIKFPVDIRRINSAPLSFAYRVIKEGILVVDKDPSKRTAFEGLVFKKYLDFAFYRNQYLKEVINAPV